MEDVTRKIKGSAAILISDANEFLLQLRDNIPTIDNPNVLGLFGGGAEQNETPEECILRELQEELELDAKHHKIKHLTTLVFSDLYKKEPCVKEIAFFVAHNIQKESLVLHEGSAIVSIPIEETITHPAMSPKAKQVLEAYRSGTI